MSGGESLACWSILIFIMWFSLTISAFTLLRSTNTLKNLLKSSQFRPMIMKFMFMAYKEWYGIDIDNKLRVRPHGILKRISLRNLKVTYAIIKSLISRVHHFLCGTQRSFWKRLPCEWYPKNHWAAGVGERRWQKVCKGTFLCAASHVSHALLDFVSESFWVHIWEELE